MKFGTFQARSAFKTPIKIVRDEFHEWPECSEDRRTICPKCTKIKFKKSVYINVHEYSKIKNQHPTFNFYGISMDFICF